VFGGQDLKRGSGYQIYALQYEQSTGAELFGVAFDFLTSSGYGWGGSIGVYKVGVGQQRRRRKTWSTFDFLSCPVRASSSLSIAQQPPPPITSPHRLPSQGNPYIYGSYNALAPNALVIPPYELRSTPAPAPSWWMSNVLIGVVGILDTDTLQVRGDVQAAKAPRSFFFNARDIVFSNRDFIQGWLCPLLTNS
jgi:hypothetical protein